MELNRPFTEIKVGEEASLSKLFNEETVETFAKLSLDNNPVHFDEEYAKNTIFGRRIVHGLLYSSLISGVLGTKLPGPGSIYLHQELNFIKPVYINDEITATVIVSNKIEEKKIIELSTNCFNQNGDQVVKGKALIKFV